MQQLTPSFTSLDQVENSSSGGIDTFTTNQSVAIDRVGFFGSSENNSLAIGLGVAFFFAYLIPFLMGPKAQEDSVTKKVNKLSEWPDSKLEIHFGPIVRDKTDYYNGYTEYGDAILELIHLNKTHPEINQKKIIQIDEQRRSPFKRNTLKDFLKCEEEIRRARNLDGDLFKKHPWQGEWVAQSKGQVWPKPTKQNIAKYFLAIHPKSTIFKVSS